MKSSPSLILRSLFLLSAAVSLTSSLTAQELTPAQLRDSYPTKIRPIVTRYCQECHSAKRMEADLDLSTFATVADLQKHPQTWQRVGEMLDSLQMPPPEATQPPEADRRALQQWVRSFLTIEAAARAGDPGKVVLRRLSNAEYTYTLRDLLGVEGLSPAKEFPVDGSAGEGFTNTGNALVMSPALVTKYLDAGKEMAAHAVLQPEGIRFSPYTTRSDWTNETLADIRNFYSQFTDPTGGEQVNLQGVIFNTNGGGRLPVEKYLAATIVERDAIRSGKKTLAAVAAERSLNAKYLGLLWQQLTDQKPSLLFSGLRQRWAAATKAEDAVALTAEIAAWQRGLWRFGSVGHIGKVGGPKRWLEPLSPLTTKQDMKFKLPAPNAGEDIVLSLVTSDLGDGNENDFVVWQQPRLVAAGRPDLLLKDVRALTQQLAERRARVFAATTKYLAACAEAQALQGAFDAAALAKKHEVDQQPLEAWLNYLGLGSGMTTKVEGHFTTKLDEAGAYKFVQGWGSNQTPLLLANSSEQHVRIPGNMKPHGVVVHPSPTLRVAVGWQSPITGKVSMSGTVTHAHTECGNGVTWSLELRRGATRRQFAAGIAQGAKEAKFGPFDDVAVQTGDVIALSIGARDNNHSCDLTNLDWQLSSPGEKVWNLAKDISSNVLAGNPHDDGLGNKNVWHFFTEADKPQPTTTAIPAGSVLAKWQTAATADEKVKLAGAVQTLLLSTGAEGSDAALHQQLTSLSGPLLGSLLTDIRTTPQSPGNEAIKNEYGLDPALFGKNPSGTAIDANSLCVRAPAVLEIKLPAALVAGCELVTSTALEPTTGKEGSAQTEIVIGKRTAATNLQPAEAKTIMGGGAWTGDNRQTSVSAPILVNDGSAAKARIEADLNAFRDLFPAALCYTKIVPVDEVVTLTLFYREDDHLVRLMLDDAQRKKLDDLWAEQHFVSQDALTLVDALEQLIQFATQDANPKVFEPLREPFAKRAADYRQQLVAAEPTHLSALLKIAAKAYRRPLLPAEQQELRQLYGKLRAQEIPHEDAIRLTLARVLVSPSFLYKIEKPVAGSKQGPVTDLELASRLSYFHWSSQPDEELLAVAAAGKLRDPQQLLAQSQRMLKSDKTRRLATEFACQWLHIYDFDQHDEKSERHFPQFAVLKDDMYEESIRFFTDLFQNNGRVLDIIEADHTFVNAELAKLYGIPNVSGPNWQRIAEAKKYERGGILAQASTLSKQSGASRTSPILRGNWISEVLLGERLPRPPKDVPQLPDEVPSAELTVRQLVEKHSGDAKCSVCHKRIDPLGFSLEGFDAIGARAAKPGDTSVQSIDGVKFSGLTGLQNYLANTRREAFVRQFCRKLLGYALGRSVQLSDEPLLTEMQTKLKAGNYQMQIALETIILSRQFREIRGIDQVVEE